MNNLLYQGVVENRNDPMKLGRCQVRVVGVHTQNKVDLRTDDLPWAYPIQPITSAAISGIGSTPVGPVPGTWVIIMFRDDEQQEPLMLGTIGGIPQSKQAQMSNSNNSNVIATDGGTLTDSSGTTITTSDGTPITVGSAESQATPHPDAKPSVDTSKDVPVSIFSIPIPIVPPPNSGANIITATKNIVGLIAACDKVGLTSKYAKSAILGIVGGETKWEPIEEYSYYKQATDLCRIFNKTFKGDTAEAQKYTKWTGSKKDFFNKIYSPEGNGSGVGNRYPDDGGKYYGRGFNQITGRDNHLKMQKAFKKMGIDLDIMTHPEELLHGEASYLACAMFYLQHCKHNMNDPGYFVSALKATGNSVGDSAVKKQKYYEYFLGESASIESTNKPSVGAQKIYTPEEVAKAPAEQQAALSEDRSVNDLIGFCDPNGKYPLRDLMNEPDTNRMARGVIESTSIAFKDAVRTTQLSRALTDSTWDQPIPPFGGVYPYAKVYESESGHVNMVDDSPGNETLSTFHRKGTYTDIDANGTQVNKIVGDNYIIMDRNGSIYIAGSAQVTFGGYANIKILGVADVEINGKTTLNVNNDVDIGIAGDLNMAVGGKFDLQVGKAFDIKTGVALGVEWKEGLSLKDNDHVYWKNNVYYAEVDMKLKGPAPIHIEGTKESLTYLGPYDINTFNVESRTGSNFRTGTHFSVESTTNSSIRSNAHVQIESVLTNNIKAGGNVNVDGKQFRGQEGKASSAPLGPVSKVSLTAPDKQPAIGGNIQPLVTPERDWTGVAKFESSDEQSTPEAILQSQIGAAITPPGVKNDPDYKETINDSASPIPLNAAPSASTATAVAGGVSIILLNDIKSRTDYPSNYKISEHFTIANFTNGNGTVLQSKNMIANRSGGARYLTVSQQVENMAFYAHNVLEVIYSIYGAQSADSTGGGKAGGTWKINDGLRYDLGSKSQHCEGSAMDIRPFSKDSDETFAMAKKLVSVLKFDQFLLEYRGPGHVRPGRPKPSTMGPNEWWRWIHISHKPAGNESQYGTLYNDGNSGGGWSKFGQLLQVDSAKL